MVLLFKNIALKHYLSCLLISWHPDNFSLKASASFSLRNAKCGRLWQCRLAPSLAVCAEGISKSLPLAPREERAVESAPQSSLVSPSPQISVMTLVLLRHGTKSLWVSRDLFDITCLAQVILKTRRESSQVGANVFSVVLKSSTELRSQPKLVNLMFSALYHNF